MVWICHVYVYMLYSRGISLLLLLDDCGEGAELSDSEGLEHLGRQAVHICSHLGRKVC